MRFSELLTAECVLPDIKANCKREAFKAIAENAAARTGVSANEIVNVLLNREKLGSTGVGEGVAIPHAKIDDLPKITGVLARLSKPIDFDAMDDQPVDLVFALLAPTNATAAHLKALAQVSRLLRDDDIRDALRGADSAEAMYLIATSDHRDNAA